MNIQIYQDSYELASAVSDRIVDIANHAIQNHNRFSIALAGGSTPQPVYRRLANNINPILNFAKVNFFWGDERCVPPDHPDSNFGAANEILLQHITLSDSNIHRMEGELEPSMAASNYQLELRSFFEDKPYFDLVLLGMGSDGHTASIFPGTETIFEKDRWVLATFIPKLDAWRITLTPGIINLAKNVIFMVSGEKKAETLKAVIEGDHQPDNLPAQIIQPERGKLTWMIDLQAASKLSR